MAKTSKIVVIACGVLEPEIRILSRGLRHILATIFLPLGLHETPVRLQRELQGAIDHAEADLAVEAIVLVYGLCGRGIENLRHARCPLVVARAHDCVTLFLGDKARYVEEQQAHPATYWYNPGWIRGKASPGPERETYLREHYSRKFEEEEVEYLLETDRASLSHYDRATYVGLNLESEKQDLEYAKTCAACQGWGFKAIPGDPALLLALLQGNWDGERFLIVPPLHAIRATGDDAIIRAEPYFDRA